MLKAVFYRHNGSPTGFSVSGHAGYGHEGTDIVCAAVTSAVQLSANAITEIAAVDAEVRAEGNLVALTLPDRTGDEGAEYAAQVILKALLLHLETLAEQYRGTIRITVMEVK